MLASSVAPLLDMVGTCDFIIYLLNLIHLYTPATVYGIEKPTEKALADQADSRLTFECINIQLMKVHNI